MKSKKCKTKHCRGRATKTGKSPHCSKCRSRKWREKYPAHYAYAKLRGSAKRRGKTFFLTRKRFVELWNEGLKFNHGREGHNLTVNRINNSLGYQDDNVELMTRSENSRKRYVPYFQGKGPSQDEIEQTGQEIREMMCNEQ